MASVGEQHLVHRRLRAPQDDRTCLIHPATLAVAESARSFRQFAEQGFRGPFAALLAELSTRARATAVKLAREYTSAYQDTSWTEGRSLTAPLILAGHQPYLFHPGVWLKNFQLSSLAEQLGGIAINWVVDNDNASPSEVRVPWLNSDESSSPHYGVTAVQLDHAVEACPYEERFVQDERLWHTFEPRLLAAMPEMLRSDKQPLITELWQHVKAGEPAQCARHDGRINYGEILAEARHQVEHACGLKTLELPLSRICKTAEFQQFSELLLDQLTSFAGHYNRLLKQYRHVNKIRSSAHPMPDLFTDGDWHEAPFWIWTSHSPQRKRLFLRQHGTAWELSDRNGTTLSMERDRQDRSAIFQSVLAQAERAGIKVRPRAIITTLFSRLVVGDTFIHGIGGAKYDELTDALMRDFLEIEPPIYQTVTATVRLGLPIDMQAGQRRLNLHQLLRDTAHRGEAFFDSRWRSLFDAAGWSRLETLATQKKNFILSGWSEGSKSEWHQRVSDCNKELLEVLTPVTQHLLREAARAESRQAEARLLGSREFSLALFDRQDLPRLLLDFCQG